VAVASGCPNLTSLHVVRVACGVVVDGVRSVGVGVLMVAADEQHAPRGMRCRCTWLVLLSSCRQVTLASIGALRLSPALAKVAKVVCTGPR